jgi:transposase-like protein
VQRYRCKICGRTFVATRGTPFYRLQTPAEEVLEVLARVAGGARITSVARATGVKHDTILAWLREAARHAEAVQEALLEHYPLSPDQVQGLLRHVQHRAVAKGEPKP